jgi:GpV-like protein with Apex motif
MNGSMEGYDEVEAIEGFDDFESTDEARFRPGIRPGIRPRRTVVAPGVVTAARLDTPRGPATLTMPAPVVTLAAHQALVQAVNANTQQINNVLARVRREIALRPRDQGQNMLPLILTLKLQQDLEEHTHGGVTAGAASTGKAQLSSASGGGLSSGLPLILLLMPGLFGQSQPGLFGQSSGGSWSSGTQDPMSSLLPMLVLLQFIRP